MFPFKLIHASLALFSRPVAREAAQQAAVGEKKDEEEEEDLSLAYAARGQANTLPCCSICCFPLWEQRVRDPPPTVPPLIAPQVSPDIRWWATSTR